jgi:hypothetical protein
MKKSVLAVFTIAVVLAAGTAAKADSIEGSIAIAGTSNAAFISTGLSLTQGGPGMTADSRRAFSMATDWATASAATFAPDNVALFEIFTGKDSAAAFSIDSTLSETIVHEILTITGSEILSETAYTETADAPNAKVNHSWRSSAVGATVSTAPEPSGLLLLGTGLAALALVVFRKAKSSAVTSRTEADRHVRPQTGTL